VKRALSNSIETHAKSIRGEETVPKLLIILMLSSAAGAWFCFLDEGRFVDTLAAIGLVIAAVLALFTGGVRSAAVTLTLEGTVVNSGALLLGHFECLK
jgi:hypothetical protein